MNQVIIDIVNEFYEISGGTWRLKSSRHRKTNAEILNNITSVMGDRKLFTSMGDLEDLSEYLDGQIASGNAVASFMTPDIYIDQTLKQLDITIHGKGDSYTRQSGMSKTTINMYLEDVMNELDNQLWYFNRAVDRTQRLSKDAIQTAFKSKLRNIKEDMHVKLAKSLVYDDANIGILDEWLERLHSTMEIDEPLDIFKMLMKQMMWLIKRNIYSMDVKDDIWLQFFGAQGVGKSYIARHVFFKPVKDFYIETELSKIEDVDREISKFTDNFVVNFDEMALGSTTDGQYKVSVKMLNNMKSMLTRDKISVRVYGTQKQEVRKKTFVAFSTANTHLYDLIYDETGMRRFFEFNSRTPRLKPDGTQNRWDYKEVEALSNMALSAWQAIDEGNDAGYWKLSSEQGNFITERQGSYFNTKSTVYIWWKDMEVTSGDTNLDDAYIDYKRYCSANGHVQSVSKNKFIEDMLHLCKKLVKENGGLTISYKD